MGNRVTGFVRANFGTLLLLVVLAGSLTVNVVVGRAYFKTPSPALGAVRLGTMLAEVPVLHLDGSPAVLKSSAERPTLLYVFSPKCGWCLRNYANILAVAEGARDRFRMVGLSNSGTTAQLREYLKEYPLPFEVVILDRARAGDVPHLQATPTTMVLNRDGVITNAWVGAFLDSRGDDVARHFGITLPGLTGTDALVDRQ